MFPALVLASAAIPAPTMPATDELSRAAVAAYIRQCADIWAKSGMSDRSAEAGRFVADDYRGVSVRGKVRRKADVIGFGPPPDKAAGLFYANIRFPTPTVAIAQGEEWVVPGDGSAKRRSIWTDIWLFRAGRWQIVTSQDSAVSVDQPLQDIVP